MYDSSILDLYTSLSEGCNKIKEDYDNDDDCEGLCSEDPENDALIVESLICESFNGEQIEQFISEGYADKLVNQGLLSEKSIVRLDKTAKLQKAESQAVLIIAKEKGDRDFKRLTTIWKVRKMLLAKLEKKYKNEAKRRAKEMVKKTSKVNTPLAKIIKK